MLLSAAHPIWTLSRVQVIAVLGSTAQGLSSSEAAIRLQRVGPNSLPAPPQRPLLLRLGDQLLHLMALLLWVAGGLALLAGTPQLAVAIWAVVLINGVFSFWQEYQAERTMAALLKALPRQVQVWRDGMLSVLAAEAVVPGDCVLLEAGDQVPADGRLIEAQELYLDLSLLTG
ncbi:MAG: cation-transporting P-type ATPase, partial [Cyanobacteriota bacterium]|nr:cation-transporting P-type ATPase [Cyanobacteriota bacterium]